MTIVHLEITERGRGIWQSLHCIFMFCVLGCWSCGHLTVFATVYHMKLEKLLYTSFSLNLLFNLNFRAQNASLLVGFHANKNKDMLICKGKYSVTCIPVFTPFTLYHEIVRVIGHFTLAIPSKSNHSAC